MNNPVQGYNALGRAFADALNRGDDAEASSVKARFLDEQQAEVVEHRHVAGMLYAEGYRAARYRRPHIFHG